MASTISRKTIEPVDTEVENTTAETAFSKTLLIPAYTLRKGFKLGFGYSWNVVDNNSTDTLTVKGYLGTAIGTTGILIGDSGALDVADGDIGVCTGWGMVHTFAGASAGILVGGSWSVPKAAGTGKFITFGAVEAQLDFLADMYLTVTGTWSVAHADNEVKLDSLWCEIEAFVH